MPTFVIEVEYPSAGALAVDVETQLALGGLLLDGAAPEGVAVGARLRLRMRVRAPGPDPVEIEALVAELGEGSICLEVDEDALATLRASSACAADVPRAAAAAPSVRFIGDGVRAGPQVAQVDPIERRLVAMTVGEKIHQALHGGREWRQLLLRDRVGPVQAALIRNPKLTLDEVVTLARAATLAAEAAEAMSKHPSYGSSAQVALALVRNPRTPVPVAVAMVAKLSPSDLRTVAKGTGVRAQVLAAARKRLIGDR